MCFKENKKSLATARLLGAEVWVERTGEVRGLDHTWVLSCSGFIRCVTGADKWVPVLRENQAPSPGMHHQVVLALQQLP